MRYVALLRGINVGGHRSLPMKDLAAIFTKAGATGVQTYIQSGNVVFEANATLAARIAAMVDQGIQAKFGFAVPITLRSKAELVKIVGANPFLKAGKAPEELHVSFLEHKPAPAQVAALDPERSGGDDLKVVGREIYLYFPRGLAKTKLTNAYFDSKLKTISTVRNWRTTLTLLEMLQ